MPNSGILFFVPFVVVNKGDEKEKENDNDKGNEKENTTVKGHENGNDKGDENEGRWPL